MESLRQAVLMGCNTVEIDIRRTLDGELVLNHDGMLERLTDGSGEAETTYYGDLQMRDAGAWMGERFAGIRIARFDDALRFAHDHDIRLFLDIKTKGIGPELLEHLKREDMLSQVQFGGEWDDVKQLYPTANASAKMTVGVSPGVTAEEVAKHHRNGEFVVANFSANSHEMDLAAMKAAVASGVDAINVDYPRLGADAVGRPVEQKLNALIVKANQGNPEARATAILDLSHYYGFPLQTEFARWLLDPDDRVSRAAALALATARPKTPDSVLTQGLHSEYADVRANTAWALGILDAPTSLLLPLLQDHDPIVLQAALMAISRAPGEVDAQTLLPLLSNNNPAVRGAAALALARHQPKIAETAVPEQLRTDMKVERSMYDDFLARGQTPLTTAEIARIVGFYRSQAKMVEAIAMLQGSDTTQVLEELAFRPGKDFSEMDGILAAFNLWDRIGAAPEPAVAALGSSDTGAADRAEWMLVQGGSQVLPLVRAALTDPNLQVRQRAIRIVAWQGDLAALGGPAADRKSRYSRLRLGRVGDCEN